jgi:hypothetical protein
MITGRTEEQSFIFAARPLASTERKSLRKKEPPRYKSNYKICAGEDLRRKGQPRPGNTSVTFAAIYQRKPEGSVALPLRCLRSRYIDINGILYAGEQVLSAVLLVVVAAVQLCV